MQFFHTESCKEEEAMQVLFYVKRLYSALRSQKYCSQLFFSHAPILMLLFPSTAVEYLWPCDQMLNLMPNLTQAFLAKLPFVCSAPLIRQREIWVLLRAVVHQVSSFVCWWQRVSQPGPWAVRSYCHTSQQAWPWPARRMLGVPVWERYRSEA